MKKSTIFLKENKKTLLTLIVVVVLADCLFIKKSYDLLTFGVLAIYILFIRVLQIKSKLTFLICMILLGVMFISYIISRASSPTEKAAVWLILFLGIGIIQQWRE